jgi:RND family efflux transporter MFP subunit
MKEPGVKSVGRSLAALSALVGVGLVLWAGSASGQVSGQPEASRLAAKMAFGERAVVKPSRDASMGFTLSTSVLEVLVSGGQAVRAGDLLIRGDDIEDVAEAKFQRARAETELPVERSRAQMELAELEYARQQDAFSKGAANQLELDRSRVARDTTKIDLDLAVLNQVLSDLQADRAEARVTKLNLRAPFDGVVDIINVDAGQSVREGEPVVRVLSVDPLWIDVPAQTAMTIAMGLHPGSRAWVLLQEDTAERVYEAEVLEVSPSADGTSGTRRVRVRMANKIGLVPGVNCWVRFTEPTGEWAGKVVDPGRAVESAGAEGER